MAAHYLQSLFAPRSVALVGATERAGALGRYVFENLVQGGYEGVLYPVNPKHSRVFGRRCAVSVVDIAEPIDLAIIVTPPPTITGILEDLGAKKIRSAIILTAGFGEAGEAGMARQLAIAAVARRHGVRLLGPNCLGLQRPSLGLNATYARTTARRGRLALVSQSGAVCTAMLDWATPNGIGFSSVVATGASADVDFGEILDYLLTDEETDAILMYVEGVRDARRFLSALRQASRSKPVVVLKGGRSRSGRRAVSTHTGALVGSDAVFDAALRRSGTVRVRSYIELFAAAKMLSFGQIPRGNRVAIVTNGGGPGVMAADAAADRGVALASLSPETLDLLDEVLPSIWSHDNPVDIVGDASPRRYRDALTAVLRDPNVDAVLTLYCPQVAASAAEVGRALVAAEQDAGVDKPLLTAWLGEAEVTAGRAVTEAANIPSFLTPETAIGAFAAAAAYRRNQALLMEVPPPEPPLSPPDLEVARMIRANALAEGRDTLSEHESKQLLQAFGLPVAPTRLAASADEAVEIARELGFPVALKIHSRNISHKSDVGGVRLNLTNSRMVQNAYEEMLEQVAAERPEAQIDGVVVQRYIKHQHGREVLIGVTTDPVFGPVISFGAGGVAVEVLRDTAAVLPPLNRKLAVDLIESTRMARQLGAYRNTPAADWEALIDMLLRVSAMVCALPWLAEVDLNPVLTSPGGATVLDARVRIDPEREETPIRYRHMAIHPYPAQWEQAVTLRDGTPLHLRPIRPEDATIEREFVLTGMSEQSRYMRFMHQLAELTPAMLARFTQIDYDREMALIAVETGPGREKMAGVARYGVLPDGRGAEFAIAVGDAWQGRGLGRLLMERLFDCAREAGIERIEGSVLAVNKGMLHLMRSLGFAVEPSPDAPDEVRVVKVLMRAGL